MMKELSQEDLKVGDRVWVVRRGMVGVRSWHWRKLEVTPDNIAILAAQYVITR